ncbi:hypothetical protein Bpfe_000190, partial [Biomphalaria pfeifferi]
MITLNSRLKRPSNEMPKIFYEFMIRLLDNSLIALHLTLAEECLEKGYLKQKEYIQTFDKAKLEALLKVVFKPIKPEEIQTFSDYGNVYYKFLNKFLKEELT